MKRTPPSNNCLIKPKQLADMLPLIEKGTISGKIAKTVFTEMYKTGKDAEEHSKRKRPSSDQR